MASRQFLPFQRKWNDDQIRFVIANQHVDAKRPADMHNARFPSLEQMDARQARSNVVRWRNHPRFNPQAAANHAGGAVGTVVGAAQASGLLPITGVSSGGGIGVGASAAMAPALASSTVRAQDVDHDDGADESSLCRGQPPPDPTNVVSPPRNTPADSAYRSISEYQPQQQYADPSLQQMNGRQYHTGPHAGCTIAATHRHGPDGELCFPSTAAFVAMMQRHAADAVAAGLHSAQQQPASRRPAVGQEPRDRPGYSSSPRP